MLTQSRLKMLFTYSPNTGEFVRNTVPGKRSDLIGKIAGGPTSDGGWRIAVENKRYKAHRLAFFYMTGKWPDAEIDHIDGNPRNNKWENLRDVSSSINKENRRTANKNSKTGLLGIRPVNGGRQYQARITVSGEEILIGSFSTPVAAHQAYLKAKRKFHKGCTI